MSEVGEIVCGVYAAGAKFVVLDDAIGVDGDLPGELKSRVRAHRAELLEALVGDPLEGPGWEAKAALYRRALQWLAGEIGIRETESSRGMYAVARTLCRQDVAGRLNTAWCDGGFDEFRAALRDYARVGLRAARLEAPRGTSLREQPR